MTSLVLPEEPSPDAFTFRQLWNERWGSYHPRNGYDAPVDAAYDHRHAHPEFRDPLSSGDRWQASAEFHAAVVSRLAEGQIVTLMTFDDEGTWQGEHYQELSSLDGLIDRELAWSLVEPPEKGETPAPRRSTSSSH